MAQLDATNAINPKKANAAALSAAQLTRDDFDGGPVSLDEVEPGLWLGNVTAATDMFNLKTIGITHILTVDSCPLPTHILQQTSITNKYIQVSDVAKEDLLSHFEPCIDFIAKSLEDNKKVLVHCYFGVSRSATIVIAYIMKIYKLSFTPAFDRVKSKRRFVGPNSGFVQQLRLFHKMGWTIEPQHEQYKTYRLRLAADKVRKAKILPQSCKDLVKTDPGTIQTKPEPIVYRCRKCRRILAAKSNVITHKAANKIVDNRRHIDDDSAGLLIDQISDKLKSNLTLSGSDQSSSLELFAAAGGGGRVAGGSPAAGSNAAAAAAASAEPCKDIFFLEPLAWMDGILLQTSGKLHCPKCTTKLGSFSWTMGCHCPCGAHVSPAFYLVPSKVELCRSVQNVQVTV